MLGKVLNESIFVEDEEDLKFFKHNLLFLLKKLFFFVNCFTEKTGRIAKTLFKMPKINSIRKNQKRFKI